MNKRVLLVGCGNIGRRHLQALAHVAVPLDITIVEPDRSAWSLAEQAYAQVGATAHALGFRESLAGPAIAADLAVVATGAEIRRAVFEDLEASHAIGAYLFEKVLFQTTADLAEVKQHLDAVGKKAWVNCGRRGFPGYRDLRTALFGMPSLDMRVTGSGWGLCSNGIHFLDLYTFVTGHELLSATGADLTGAIPSKRAGNVELTGHLRCRAEQGGVVDVVCHASGSAPLTVEFLGPDVRVVVDETGGTVTTFPAKGEPQSRRFASRFVSEMPYFYQDIVEKGECDLPTYDLSARQHALFLDIVHNHLKLEADERCPIT